MKPSGREYLRVSVDRSGYEKSTVEQHEENRRAASERGVELGRPYVDANVSASRYATRARDDFPKLLEDLRLDRFGAGKLWLWESSRGSRRVGEWVELIELCEDRSVRIFVTTHARLYDPANPRDRRSLLEDAVDSEYESAKTSLRAKRAAAAAAAEGRPNGHCPFGYVRVYDKTTGRRVLRQEPHPEQATVIRELYKRLHRGESLRSIGRVFETQGYRTQTGRVISQQRLRQWALNPAYAGWRVHAPGLRGKTPRLEDGPRYDAQWPALVDRKIFLAVYRRLTDPARRTSRPGRGKHLLSMIAKCGVCGRPLTASYREYRNGIRTYQCHSTGHVRIVADDLDTFAENAILGYLQRDDVHERLFAAEQLDSDELEQVRTGLAEARTELDTLRTAASTGKVSVASFLAVEPGLVARVEDLEHRENELTTPTALHALLSPGADLQARWDAADTPARREVARLVLASRLLGELRLMRSPRPGGTRGMVPVEDRIEWGQEPTPSPTVPAQREHPAEPAARKPRRRSARRGSAGR